jgi:4-aminobutyrate aminotransferase-like enzyme
MTEKFNKAFKELKKYECRSMHGQLPILWQSAEGCIVTDHEGDKYLDFTSSIFVANIGHSNPDVLAAIKDVIDSKLLHTYTYLNKYRIQYLKKLIEFAGAPFEKAFLASSGTEATESAMKLMRMHGFKINKKRKPGIISFNGSWHGRTMGSFMMSGGNSTNWWIGYEDPNIHHFNFPFPWKVSESEGEKAFFDEIKNLEKAGIIISKDICGFMIETFQGWGVLFYPKSYIKALVNFAKENNILVCFDEMQSGFYRTGKKFGYKHYDIEPDMICIGKGMGSGLPISGILGKTETLNLPLPGEMSSTNSANPLVCAAGLATIEYIENNNLEGHIQKVEKTFINELERIKETAPVKINFFSKGLVAAILFYEEDGVTPDIEFTNKVVDECLKNKLIVVKTGRESIKLGPPLIISESQIKKGMRIIEKSIFKINASSEFKSTTTK